MVRIGSTISPQVHLVYNNCIDAHDTADLSHSQHALGRATTPSDWGPSEAENDLAHVNDTERVKVEQDEAPLTQYFLNYPSFPTQTDESSLRPPTPAQRQKPRDLPTSSSADYAQTSSAVKVEPSQSHLDLSSFSSLDQVQQNAGQTPNSPMQTQSQVTFDVSVSQAEDRPVRIFVPDSDQSQTQSRLQLESQPLSISSLSQPNLSSEPQIFQTNQKPASPVQSHPAPAQAVLQKSRSQRSRSPDSVNRRKTFRGGVARKRASTAHELDISNGPYATPRSSPVRAVDESICESATRRRASSSVKRIKEEEAEFSFTPLPKPPRSALKASIRRIIS